MTWQNTANIDTAASVKGYNPVIPTETPEYRHYLHWFVIESSLLFASRGDFYFPSKQSMSVCSKLINAYMTISYWDLVRTKSDMKQAGVTDMKDHDGVSPQDIVPQSHGESELTGIFCTGLHSVLLPPWLNEKWPQNFKFMLVLLEHMWTQAGLQTRVGLTFHWIPTQNERLLRSFLPTPGCGQPSARITKDPDTDFILGSSAATTSPGLIEETTSSLGFCFSLQHQPHPSVSPGSSQSTP